MFRKKCASSGFSLAEVLVAVALLGVILLALMGLMSASVHRAYSGKKMTEATFLAQAAMERANTYEAYTLLGADEDDTGAEQEWTKVGGVASPAAVTGTSAEAIERTEWSKMLAASGIPADNTFPATMKVSMTPIPAGKFKDASMVRIVVDVSWTEWGKRPRRVRLQSLNLRTTP